MSTLQETLKTKPKAELHMHIEGSLEPEMMFNLAKRNGVALPYTDVAAVRQAYQFENLQGFLDLYYAGTDVLQTEQDFFELANAYLERAHSEGVVLAEFFFDPQAHLARGIAAETFMQGFQRAISAAEARGTTAGMIMCFMRHLSEADAFDTLEVMAPYHQDILAVGLDSSEVGHPPTKFANVFEAAAKLGLKRVAHAGEEGPPEYIWQALDVLGVDRIDHGNAALQDKALMQRLRQDQIPLTLCPLSNLKLCVIDQLADHPVKTFLDAGMKVTLNSDDPAYFGGYLLDNLVQTAEALNLSETDMATVLDNGMNAGFLSTG